MTTTEIIDSLEKELAQLQINLQAHIQIKQVLNAMRGDLDNSKNGNNGNNGKEGGQKSFSGRKEVKKGE